MKNQEAKDITCKKIAWTIPNFSSLKNNAIHFSEFFTLCNWAWKIFIYKGIIDAQSLAVYLGPADTLSLPQGWRIRAAFRLTVVNQVSRKKSISKGDEDVVVEFYANNIWWGTLFMSSSELDPYKGYVLNDKCIIEVELFSVTYGGFEPISRPKDDDDVDFKDLGKINKSFVPMLEEVCSWHPLLLDYKKNKSRKFTEWAFTLLGRVLQFLKDKKWKDMNDEACEQLQYLWEELEISRLDLCWLEPLVKSAINMRGYAEKVEKVKKMKQNLMVAETKMNMIKQKLASTKQSVEMIRKELVNIEQDFEEKDLNAKIVYGKPQSYT